MSTAREGLLLTLLGALWFPCLIAGCVGPPFVTSTEDPIGPSIAASSSGGAPIGGDGNVPSITIDGAVGAGGTAGGGGSGGSAGTGGSGGTTAENAILVVDQFHHPVAGASLVVNDASGAFLLASTSSPDGTASMVIPEGGSVSVFSSTLLETGVTSFVAPPMGAPITLGVRVTPPAAPPPAPPTEFHVVVSYPAGITSFKCFNACDESSGTAEGHVCTLTNNGCADAPSADILAVAYKDDKPVTWGTALGVAVSPGIVNVVVPATQVMPSMAATITGIPVDAGMAGVGLRGYVSPTLSFSHVASVSPPGSSLNASLAVLSGLLGGYEITEAVGSFGPLSMRLVKRVRRYASWPAQTSFAADTMAQISLNPLDLSDLSHPVVSWTASGASKGDAVKVELHWHQGFTKGSYVAYLPPGYATSFRMPDVPPALAKHVPTALSVVDAFSATYIEDEAVDGYWPMLTTVYGGAGAQDGLGVLESSASSLEAQP